MSRIGVRITTAAVAASFAFTSVARADEGDDVRKIVREEIKATMDKKKEDDTKDAVFKATWKDGLTFETPDKRFKVKIGGRIHLDNVTFFEPSDTLSKFKIPQVPTAYPDSPTPTAIGAFHDALYLRRLRLAVSGDMYKHVEWKVQLDFAKGSEVEFKDVFIELHDLKECLGCWAPALRVGQFHDPVSLEEISTSNYNTFIERSLMDNLVPARALGFMVWDHFWHDRCTLSAGVFAADQDDENLGFAEWKDGWAATARGTLIPWAKDTCHFLHLGASYSHREFPSVRYRARPEVGFGPRVVDTGTQANAEGAEMIGAEAALVWGSLSLQGEYVLDDVNDPVTGDPTFDGWYAQASWFITGESRAYDFKNGKWGRTKPCCNFLEKDCCCFGALELAVRYSSLNLTDGLVFGGEAADWTLGLNWYLNPNTRVMFNFIHANVKNLGLDEDLNALLIRVQVDF